MSDVSVAFGCAVVVVDCAVVVVWDSAVVDVVFAPFVVLVVDSAGVVVLVVAVVRRPEMSITGGQTGFSFPTTEQKRVKSSLNRTVKEIKILIES